MAVAGKVAAPRGAAKVSRGAVLAACVIGLLLALSFAYGAWTLAADRLHMIAVGLPADGTMIGHKEVRHTGRRGDYLATTYHPTFSYRVQDGGTAQGTTLDSLDREEIRVGRVMRVVYDPADPGHVRLAESLERGFGSNVWLLGAAALLSGALSLIGLLWRRRA
ncbi:DUF3592 domain-containing protein [Vineibacter terrae]|uniref:DUF3592 domain-containing protein n=1 Tax=Vineibacter terrae TaxID=2586908 RepID=UPI002E31F7BD|nr:DUF3592 domain-containing protein [Vineibacter terrae]HEX2891450.1 DUF3592 domain-containing protein [Vineibacter terrae]